MPASPDNTHCDYPLSHIWINPLGNIRPCCVYDPWQGAQNPRDRYEPHQLLEFFNGSAMESMRDELSRGIKHVGCRYCWDMEALGLPTDRLNPLTEIKDSTDKKLRYLEFGAGRTCNLKCRTCWSGASTSWEKEEVEHGGTEWHPPNGFQLRCDKIPMEAFQDVTNIKVTGGEPFLNKPFATLLQKLVDAGHASKMHCLVITNCSALPDDDFLIPLLRFKAVTIRCSIDGIGMRNEYIRSGSNWADTVDTLRGWGRLSAVERAIKDMEISHCFSALNAFYLEEMIAWCREMRRYPGLSDMRLSFNPLHEPWFYAAYNLPQQAKTAIIEQLRVSCDGGHDDKVRYLAMSLLRKQASSDAMTAMMEYNGRLDQRRGTDIAHALPDLYRAAIG